MKPKLFVIDGHNLIYRMFYAVRGLTAPDGSPVGAVFGTVKAFLSWHAVEKPDYLVVTLDAPGGSWRDEMYAEYKANRDETPGELRSQEGAIFEFLDAAGIRFLQKPGWEADDVIGTLATKYSGDFDVYVISSDKDLYAFVNDSVAVYDPMKRKLSRRPEAIEKFGVPPEFVPDWLALVGDASDNIPGVAGLGPKGASDLINQFGGIEAIYGAVLEGRVPEKYAKKLRASEREAWLSKKLATIDADVPLPGFDVESCRYAGREIFTPRVLELLEKWGFRSMAPKTAAPEPEFAAKIAHVRPSDASRLPELEEKIRAAGRAGLSTWGRGIDLLGAAFALPGGEVWMLDCAKIDCRGFFDRLLPSDAVLEGWDVKNDLRRIRFHQTNGTT